MAAVVVGLLFALTGCGEATRPLPPPEVIGDFDLAQVDGRALPETVTLAGVQCEITQSTLRLRAGRKWEWMWTCAVPNAAPTEHLTGDWFDQPAADSIVFPTKMPTVPAYWATGRINGDVLEIATLYPVSSAPVDATFGEHRWTFRRSAASTEFQR